jgi:RNA polymerase sigma-70 factor (ECF subfamily)
LPTLATDTLVPLVAAARTGDAAALDRLFRRYAPVVHGVLLAYVPHADADDLTQDVFETVLARLPALRDDAAFPGWVTAIARRAALGAHRGRRNVVALDAEALPDAADPAARAEAERALAAIRRLPPAYREPLVLRLVEGLDGPEIATLTGLTPGSVRVNLHRGMAQLRALLADPPEDPA